MTEIHFDFNSLFIILLILLIGGYLYYEIYKLKRVINEIQYKLIFVRLLWLVEKYLLFFYSEMTKMLNLRFFLQTMEAPPPFRPS